MSDEERLVLRQMVAVAYAALSSDVVETTDEISVDHGQTYESVEMIFDKARAILGSAYTTH